MKHSEQKQKTMICHFKGWLKDWDEKISTYDNLKSYEIQSERCKLSISILSKLLNESDDKVMKGKTEKEAVEAMFKNQKKEWYKNLSKIRDFLQVLIYEIEKMQEINNRKTDEIFKLKSEIAKLKQVNND